MSSTSSPRSASAPKVGAAAAVDRAPAASPGASRPPPPARASSSPSGGPAGPRACALALTPAIEPDPARAPRRATRAGPTRGSAAPIDARGDDDRHVTTMAAEGASPPLGRARSRAALRAGDVAADHRGQRPRRPMPTVRGPDGPRRHRKGRGADEHPERQRPPANAPQVGHHGRQHGPDDHAGGDGQSESLTDGERSPSAGRRRLQAAPASSTRSSPTCPRDGPRSRPRHKAARRDEPGRTGSPPARPHDLPRPRALRGPVRQAHAGDALVGDAGPDGDHGAARGHLAGRRPARHFHLPARELRRADDADRARVLRRGPPVRPHRGLRGDQGVHRRGDGRGGHAARPRRPDRHHRRPAGDRPDLARPCSTPATP